MSDVKARAAAIDEIAVSIDQVTTKMMGNVVRSPTNINTTQRK